MNLKKKINNFIKKDYKSTILNCGFMINPYRFAAAGFDPNSVTGLKIWLDASDATTITKSSNLVSQWNDKSGEANILVQATGASKPLWVDAVQNGKPIIRFDGVNDDMRDTSTNTYAQPNTLFMVCSNPTNDPANRAMFDGIAPTRNLICVFDPSIYLMNSGSSVSGGTLQSGFKLFRVKFNGASSSLHINGSSILSGNAGTNSLSGISIGSLDSGGSGFANYDVCEILFYSAVVSSGDITSIESYLTTKWGL